MPPVTLSAGDLRHSVQIQQRSTTQDATGSPVDVWTTIRTCWAAVAIAKSPAAKEAFQSNEYSGQVTHTVTVRYRSSPSVTPGMRVLFGSHTYQIQTVENPDMRNVRMDLQCIEINGGQ